MQRSWLLVSLVFAAALPACKARTQSSVASVESTDGAPMDVRGIADAIVRKTQAISQLLQVATTYDGSHVEGLALADEPVPAVAAQAQASGANIEERLAKVEAENAQLKKEMDEMRALLKQLAVATATVNTPEHHDGAAIRQARDSLRALESALQSPEESRRQQLVTELGVPCYIYTNDMTVPTYKRVSYGYEWEKTFWYHTVQIDGDSVNYERMWENAQEKEYAATVQTFKRKLEVFGINHPRCRFTGDELRTRLLEVADLGPDLGLKCYDFSQPKRQPNKYGAMLYGYERVLKNGQSETQWVEAEKEQAIRSFAAYRKCAP